MSQMHLEKDKEKEEGSPSSQILTYSDIASSKKYTLPVDEDELMKRIEDFRIPEEVAEVVTKDPMYSSKKIPYYRNTNKNVFSILINVPESLQRLQDINTIMLKAYGSIFSNTHISVIDYTEYKKGSPLKIGALETLTRVYQELVFLFQLKEKVDYENSSLKSFSNITTFFLKKVKNTRATSSGHLSDTFSSAEHKFLQEKLNLRTDTLAYKLLYQLYTICTKIYICGPNDSTMKRQIAQIYSAKQQMVNLRRNINEVNEIEPIYQWISILSPVERSESVKYLGRNYFKEYTQLIDKVKKNDPSARADAKALNTAIKTNLPSEFFGKIYGRMKLFHMAKKDHPNEFTPLKKRESSSGSSSSERRGIKTPTYAQMISIMGKINRQSASLFAPQSTLVTLTRDSIYNTAGSIAEILNYAVFNAGADQIVFNRNVLECKTYKELKAHSIGNSQLTLLVSSIQDAAIA